MSYPPIFMKKSPTSFWCLVLSLFAGVAALTAPLRAQTAGQTITLSPGWNAVWLEVEPVNATGQAKAPEDVFDNPAIQTVTSPKPLSGLAEFFASDPDSATSFNEDEWEQWKRNDVTGSNNLPLISGNRPYLVQVAAGPPIVLTLTGKASFYRPAWTPDRYNLIGFGLQGTPTFDAFFGPSGTRHPVAKIFTLNAATGNWEHVTGSAQMVSGQAYWVFCSGASSYAGPVAVDFERSKSGELNFGGSLDTEAGGSGTAVFELELFVISWNSIWRRSSSPIPEPPPPLRISIWSRQTPAPEISHSML
jgi:hypothetical protein